MAGGGGEGKTWIVVLVAGLVAIGAALGLEASGSGELLTGDQ